MSNQNDLQVEATENQVTNLTFEQFNTFCSYVWKEESFWSQIASREAARSFDYGWSYCESSLTFVANNGWNWEYIPLPPRISD